MSDAPIFIVGCGHSGTTLLLSILAQHSRIHAIPYESKLFWRDEAERPDFLRRFAEETAAAGKARWVEKTPRHILRLGAIFARFEHVRVVLMMRDGRDVACSIRDRTGDLGGGARRWVEDNAAADPFRARDDVFELRYEALIADPETSLHAVMQFVGETFEPALLRHHEGSFRFYGGVNKMEKFKEAIDGLDEEPASKSGSDHKLYRSWQARQPLFDGRGRWRDDLTVQEKRIVEGIAGDALARYEYA